MEKKILSKEPILGEKGSKWLKTGFRWTENARNVKKLQKITKKQEK